jgi:hypothetical protein
VCASLANPHTAALKGNVFPLDAPSLNLSRWQRRALPIVRQVEDFLRTNLPISIHVNRRSRRQMWDHREDNAEDDH